MEVRVELEDKTHAGDFIEILTYDGVTRKCADHFVSIISIHSYLLNMYMIIAFCDNVHKQSYIRVDDDKMWAPYYDKNFTYDDEKFMVAGQTDDTDFVYDIARHILTHTELSKDQVEEFVNIKMKNCHNYVRNIVKKMNDHV